MNFFNIISSKFYNELRNKSNFSANLGQYTDELIGNVGETVQLIRVVTSETTILADDFGTFDYVVGGSYGTFTFTGNWFTEGLSVGATVDITWNNGTQTVSETIVSVTGAGGTVLNVTKVNLDLAGLTTAPRDDFEIRVTSVADRVTYKYALNQLSSNTNNYQSPLDNNQQAYYTNAITGLYQTLQRIGNDVSWDLGAVEMKFNPTANPYVHEYEIRHTFKIPYYKDGQIGNIENLLLPSTLVGTNSYKYGFGLFLAETNNNYNRILEDSGLNGSVGYYNENFNGFSNDYEIQNLVISNAHNSQTLEGTDTNTVTFQIKNNASNFVANQEVIIKHSKLPNGSEYQNKNDSFDDIWLTDSLETEVGFISVNSSVITNCDVMLNADPTLLDVSFEVGYTTNEQLLIEDTKNWLMSVLIDDNSILPDVSNRVNLKIDSQLWSFDNDVYGLVQNNSVLFCTSSELNIYDSSFTNFSGWDGDFIGVYFAFQTRAEYQAKIIGCVFRLIAYKNGIEQFEIGSTPVNIGGLIGTTISSLTVYPYQLTNIDYQNSFNITSNESFNRIKLTSVVPAFGTVWQDWSGELAFEVNWREWIANSNVPNVFYDATKQNDNKNEKTSNYSNLNGYDIYGVVDVTIGSNQGANTVYRLNSDSSIELDFDVSGTNPFIGTTYFYDINNIAINNIYNNQNVRIEIEFDHSLGILTKIGGEIWIEKDNSINKPWRLSTHKDWSNQNNPLQPSDTLLTGNITLVEVVIISNKVTLICETNNLNLDPNVNYNIYGRIFNT